MFDPDATPQFDEIGLAINKLFGTLSCIGRMDPNLNRDKDWTNMLTASHELFSRLVLFRSAVTLRGRRAN